MERVSLEGFLEELCERTGKRVLSLGNSSHALYKGESRVTDSIDPLAYWALARLSFKLWRRGSFPQIAAASPRTEAKNLLVPYMQQLSSSGLVKPLWDGTRDEVVYEVQDLKDYTLELATAEWRAVKTG